MSDALTPTFAKTSSGGDLPLLSLPQTELLTLQTDELPVVETEPGLHLQLLRLDLEAGRWVVLVHLEPGTSVPIHYHTGTAEVFTLKGRWVYREYPDQAQTPGSYLFEPGGSVHTLHAPEDNTGNTVMLVSVDGANVNFTEDGRFHSILDAVAIKHWFQHFADEQGVKARYITTGAAGYTETE
ncbi:2,4'-dihydroxyacetophenone dioxygenase [Streptomyces viridiviolaceus]|uniref:2,4'-dihydroxyacetophenone dioxygenase family protein n=1 Tax=Streptomyces viridiviolaceus TaxID=68282 RepID=A0ABW2DUV9_9ACTN|nr:2,4'-dihydroxyacetophenone dioxygenase family protein [Streptomyces viridiviolaceus]GHB32767.1 2,4'-dihydroxyacetophenone dioxygenase [Streptomyces viridiviolaceus]